MRRLILVGILTLITIPAWAAHRVSVSQLEQTLSASLAKYHNDSDIAHLLGNLELSERLTPRTLSRLVSLPGVRPQTALALELMADQSALLDPPGDEIPATAPPDAAAQQRILAAARGYVVDTIPRLPNFFATRSTVRFDDSAQVLHTGEWPVRNGFHAIGKSSRTVTVRDGHEVADAPQNVAAKTPPDQGLYSFGEFGPILARTLTDLAKGKIQFSHWEESPLGVAAVYDYSVPKHESHYEVHFCCLVDQEFHGSASYRPRNQPRNSLGAPNPVESTGLKSYDFTPAYRGTMSVDPVSGAIVRMTLDAELDPDSPITRASTIVEYGKVVIGDQTFICPVRSLAISAQEGPPSPNGDPQRVPILSINETTFTQYHRLGSSSRVIADPVLQAAAKDPSAAPQWVASTAPENTTIPDAHPPADAGPAPAANTSAAAAPPSAQAQPAAPPAEPAVPEMSMSESTGVPDTPATSSQPQDTGFSLKVTTRLVDVTVIAFDKKGHPVTDLKSEDFELYDDGKKQDIRFFSGSAPAPQATPASVEETPLTFSNREPAPAEGGAAAPQAPSQAPPGGTILIIDESHIAWNDLNYARGQMLQFLSKLPGGERVGLYSMTGLGFRVLVELTSDHAAVTARLKAFLPTAQSVSQAHEEERRNRQQFDTVHNAADLNSVNGNHNEAPDAEQPVDPELLTMGSNPARASMIILAQVARHLAAIPGHKNLVWVSSDNVLADWQDQTVGIDKTPNHNETYAIRVQEAMNDAHTAVYPFDVSQLEGGAIGADMQHSSVQLDQAASENASTAASAGAGGGSGSPSRGNRDTGTGRISAAISQDLHPIQGMVREVATGTGGRTIRRSGDLAAALDSIVADGRSIYQLSFSPSAPADDRYHPITVKLTGHRGVTLRYRTGYLYAKEPASLKERFQQAVWRPNDMSEIAITAKLTPSGTESSISLNIAARDLSMAQQGGRWMDMLDIFFIQRDDAGIRAHVQGQALGLRLKPSTYQNVLTSGIPFDRALTIPPGVGSVRIVVVDENSGRMGSVTIPASSLQAPR